MKKLSHRMIFASSLALACLAWNDSHGDDPQAPQTKLIQPKNLQPKVIQPPAAQGPTEQRIQDALKGKSVQSRDDFEQDMLNVLKDRGSILKGSLLDELSQSDSQSKPTRGLHAPNQVSNDSSQRARVAESLLKSARLIQKLGKLNDSQSRLVRQLREQAHDLLSAPSS